ncbi:hypothetical protein HAX54_047703, partial [Datura stramonium]|nr:hypothetical protein [Datura stramonium]
RRLLANVFEGEGIAADYGDGKAAQGFKTSRSYRKWVISWRERLDRFDKVEYSEGDFDEPLSNKARISEKNLCTKSSIPQIVFDTDTELTDLKESEDGENQVVHWKKHANGKSCTIGVDRNIRGRRELPLWMRGGEKNGKMEDFGKKAMNKGKFKYII